ncbi:MAG: efflux RND transporter permease subunit, partial [Myxococcales bacterium]|nr:efflux RND transporter permease subunit [Myxococcales bacterium]
MSAFAVKRWQLTLVVFFGLVAMGAQALLSIPKAEDPTFPLPTFAIVAVLPGSTPRDVERLVVDPVEAKIDRLENVKSIKTQIDDSLAIVQVEFVAGVDVDRKYDEVLREVNALRPDLPPELVRLDVRKFNAADVNIRQVALVSEDAPFRELEDQARALERRLEGQLGVGDVQTQGYPEQEVRIELDLERMVALGISPLELINAVGADASEIPAGSVDAGARRLNVKTSGDYRSVQEIEDTPIRAPGGGAVV